MVFKTRRNSGSLHRVIGDVLVLGLLVVNKIPYSSYVFNTAVVVACHIYSWFLPMSWILDLMFFMSICPAYIYIYTSKYMFGWLCRATCCFVSTSMLGMSHGVQNEKLYCITCR